MTKGENAKRKRLILISLLIYNSLLFPMDPEISYLASQVTQYPPFCPEELEQAQRGNQFSEKCWTEFSIPIAICYCCSCITFCIFVPMFIIALLVPYNKTFDAIAGYGFAASILGTFICSFCCFITSQRLKQLKSTKDTIEQAQQGNIQPLVHQEQVESANEYTPLLADHLTQSTARQAPTLKRLSMNALPFTHINQLKRLTGLSLDLEELRAEKIKIFLIRTNLRKTIGLKPEKQV